MKIDFLQEPELEFAGHARHVDIRFGLMNYGPLDCSEPVAPKQINVGVVGTAQTIEGVSAWLARCRDGIPAKASKQPNLFPRFPGCKADAGFRVALVLDSTLQRAIPAQQLNELRKYAGTNLVVTEATNIFYEELQYLAQNTPADVLVVAIPMDLLEAMNPEEANDEEEGIEEKKDKEASPDFHDLLKAKCMELRKPIQLVLPMTYDESKRRRMKTRKDRFRRPQDEATRAWNFHTALYYKAGGVPWRLVRESSQLYVGISFYKTLDQTKLLTSVAQVFNERGEGVIVRGGLAKVTKEDKQAHLEGQDAFSLLNDALARYKEVHGNLPARVVLHKSSLYNDEEFSGFTQSIRSKGISSGDLISMDKSFTRLYRRGLYPPLRGTLVTLSEQSHLLYTRGSVDFFATYPGMYVPRSLGWQCRQAEQGTRFLAEELLALTKMNWNNTQFDGGLPITLRAARQVGAILKYVGDLPIQPRYSYYM